MSFLKIFVTCWSIIFLVQSFNKYFIENGQAAGQAAIINIQIENNRGHFETETILLAALICSYLPLHELENL